MTVNANDTVETYTISGTGPYAYSFRIFDETDLTLVALSTDSPPAVAPLTYVTHYTVAGSGESDGGSVTLTAGAASTYAGYTLDIRSNTPHEQATSIRNQARFLPEIHEDAFDNLSRQVQDLNRRLELCIRFPDNMAPDGEMTPIQSWASKYVAVSAAGVLEPAVLTSLGTLTSSIIGTTLDSLKRTEAEIIAGVTPTNYAYPPYTPERYGAVGDGATADTTAVQAALTAVPSHGTVVLSGNYAIGSSGLTITNKTNITVRGSGMLKLVSADVDAVIIKLVGTCDNVTIRGVRFEGAGNAGATYFQNGVYSNSGQTLSGVRVEGCRFKNLNSAISFNADSSGTAINCKALVNIIEDMVGTEGGQGYGVHFANALDVEVASNTIVGCQRHAIYGARGSTTPGNDYGANIHDNTIRDHRSTVANGLTRPAIYCVRGYGYFVHHNKIIDYSDGAIAVQHDTVDGTSAGDSLIEANTLIGRQNAVPSIWVGEQDDPSSVRTHNVRVANNFIRSDFAVTASAVEISVYNGLGVDVVDNRLYLANLTNAAHRPIVIGEFAATGSLDMNNVNVLRNSVSGSLSGSGYLPIRLVYVATDAATAPGGNPCTVRIADNEVDPLLLSVTAEFQSTQTNKRCVVKDQWGATVGVYTDADTAPSVFGGVTHLTVTNSGATNLATLADPVPGQRITLTFTDANTTVKHSTGNMRLIGGADITSAVRKVVMLEYSHSYTQWLEVAVAANS